MYDTIFNNILWQYVIFIERIEEDGGNRNSWRKTEHSDVTRVPGRKGST